MRTLFITRDGPGLTYLESLFVPIFERLGARGFPFDVMQFRWGSASEEEAARRACRAAGIGYYTAPIWRRPAGIAPFASALAGRRHVLRAVRKFGTDALMVRGSLAALSAGPAQKSLPMIYDADGFEIDERVDFGGLSSSGVSYRMLRDMESEAVRRAERVVVRTAFAPDILIARAGPPVGKDRFQVVTNGRDEKAFHPHDTESRRAVREALGIAHEAPLIVYVGTIGYRQRTSRVAEFALAVRQLRPDTRLLVLSGSPEEAREALTTSTPQLEAFTTILRAPPEEVPRYLAAADVGAAFVHRSFSTQGVSPLKSAEYLLCGVPVVGTSRIGRHDDAIEAGAFFDEDLGLDASARWVTESVLPQREEYRCRARAVGLSHFSLEKSVDDYLVPLQHLSGIIAHARAIKVEGRPPAAAD